MVLYKKRNMKLRHWCASGLLTFLLLAPTGSDAQNSPKLVSVGTYDTGLGENGAEILSVRRFDKIAALTNIAGNIDLLDISNPSQISLIRRIPVDPAFGTPNSVAIHPYRDYFLVASGRSGSTGRVSAYRLSDGVFLASAPVGILPDSIAISPNGQYAVIANEAEATAQGNNGGAGSLSVVSLRGFNPNNPAFLPVTAVALPSQNGVPGFSTGRTDDIGRLSVDNTPGTLEPESVAFSSDSRYAYVTLQENSGAVRIELQTLALTFFGLGQTTHPADLTNDNIYNPIETLTAFREPDGIALTSDNRYFATADEGDTRNASGNNATRGGRTVSLFDAETGAFVADTGNQLDNAAAAAGIYPDSRSNRGGSEPEVLDVESFRGRTLVAVGLERANAVALIDATNPEAPIVVDLAVTGTGPEGIKFFRSGSKLYLLTANEVSGTVSAFEVAF